MVYGKMANDLETIICMVLVSCDLGPMDDVDTIIVVESNADNDDILWEMEIIFLLTYIAIDGEEIPIEFSPTIGTYLDSSCKRMPSLSITTSLYHFSFAWGKCGHSHTEILIHSNH